MSARRLHPGSLDSILDVTMYSPFPNFGSALNALPTQSQPLEARTVARTPREIKDRTARKDSAGAFPPNLRHGCVIQVHVARAAQSPETSSNLW